MTGRVFLYEETYAVMERTYLLDVLKIVEGAANADHEKVMSYARHLCEQLEADGEKEAARRLTQILSGGKISKMSLAKAGGGVPSRILPVDSESRLTTADEEMVRPGEVEVFLAPEVRATVSQFLAYLGAADRLLANGVGISPSLLMYGPPGCGKTLVARFIASELGLPLITARVDGLISSYLGSTSKNLRMLFEHAMSRPCVLFLDEFDAIAKMRDDAKELGELKRVVISLLQNIDVMGKDHVLLAATNHEHLLDPAVWRRFAYKLQLGEPDKAARLKMLSRFLGTFSSEDAVEVLASLSEGLTGAQLKLIADDCIRDAVLQDRQSISLKRAIEGVLENSKTLRSGTGLGDELRTLREIDPKTFTQTRLSEIFGVSQGQISKMLKENRP
jgi:SpoVK/Ycf46/Vps4 family AAA+-type ATPase